MKSEENRWTRRKLLQSLATTGAAMGVTSRPYLGASVPAGAPPVRTGGADWPRFGHNLQNTRFNSQESKLTRSNVDRLKLKWAFESEAPFQSTPTVVGDTVYFGTLLGYQYAVEASTGKVKWNFSAGYDERRNAADQGLRSSSQYHDGRLYFSTSLTKIHCLDAESGRELWQTQLDEDPMKNRAQILCSTAVHRGKVYVGTSSGEAQAVCLDAETGAVRWRFYVVPDRSRGAGGSIWTSPAIDEAANIVYFSTGSVKSYSGNDPILFTESLLAFDADTGELLWYDQLRPADPFDLDYSCHPMVFDAVHPARKQETRPCVAAGNKAGMFCFNRYTGKKYWKAMLTNATNKGGPLVNSTAVAYNRVFIVSNSAGIRGRPAMSVAAGLHAYTGDIQWWVANPALIEGPVAVAGEVFYQGLQNGTLEAIDARTGEQLWKHDLPGPIRGGMSIANGSLYTSTGTSVDWNVRDLRADRTYKVYAFSPDGQ